MPQLVEFRDFVHRGESVIDQWLSEQPKEVRAEYDSMFPILAVLPERWQRPWVVPLHGPKYRGILEFRVKVRVPYRIFGFRGPVAGQVTLCSAVCKNQNKGIQAASQDLAVRRRIMVENGEAGTVTHV